MANGGNVLSLNTTAATSSISKSFNTKEIDSVFTTSSSKSSVLDIKSSEINLMIACSDHRHIITYQHTNFNESNINKSSECSNENEMENIVNMNESSLDNRQPLRRFPRRNAKIKGKKAKESTEAPSSDINVTNRVQKRGKVSLLGLFELTSRSGLLRAEGKSELAAAELAVKHINERRLLKGYTLELITNDTQVIKIKLNC